MSGMRVLAQQPRQAGRWVPEALWPWGPFRLHCLDPPSLSPLPALFSPFSSHLSSSPNPSRVFFHQGNLRPSVSVPHSAFTEDRSPTSLLNSPQAPGGTAL